MEEDYDEEEAVCRSYKIRSLIKLIAVGVKNIEKNSTALSKISEHDKFKKAMYGAPKNRATAVLKIELNNRLDMKVKSNADAKKSSKKIPIVESFDWSTSYDFQENQHPWDDIQFKTRTSLFDKLFDIDFKSTFDPYLYKDTGLLDEHHKKKYTKKYT